jgi:hypothetical protein
MRFIMFQGWKTLIFSSLVALVGVAESADWVSLLGSETAGYVLTAVGIVSAALRFLTTTPAGKKA